MILSFHPQFIPLILEGKKVHTIRKDALNRWKPGMKIHVATGARTKHYQQHTVLQCVSTQEIKINHFGDATEMIIDGELFGTCFHLGLSLDTIYEWNDCVEELARNDGFKEVEDFFGWFSEDFKGKIIHWTDLKY